MKFMQIGSNRVILLQGSCSIESWIFQGPNVTDKSIGRTPPFYYRGPREAIASDTPEIGYKTECWVTREREREWPLYWMSATNSLQFQFALLVCACHLSTGTNARSSLLLDYEDITNESWLYEMAARGYVITHVRPTCTVRPHKSPTSRYSANISRLRFLRDRHER